MTNTGIRLVVLLILQTPWLPASYSADGSNPAFNLEVSKQESIYHSQGDRVVEGYTIDRSLKDYIRGLPSGFDDSLANLGPKDRWLDIGAGKGQAILDYYTPDYDLMYPEGRALRGKKAQTVAMSIEDRRTPLWRQTAASLEPKQIQYIFNKRLREYSLDELGQFQVITDVIGGFSYTDTLSQFMERVLGILKINGSFYTVLQDVHTEEGTNKPFYAGSPFLTEIAKTDGAKMKVCEWLKSISCVEVTCESRTDWKPPLEAFHVRKVCDGVAVPALDMVHYEAGTPPERRFKLKN
ncbi:MAG: hypothetical protein Q8K18_04380 [Burkholderiales bacterium]|nr:hypothetical protein [Burkholderiales bacterium]